MPTHADSPRKFSALLKGAMADGHPAPAEADLDPAALTDSNAIAAAWPRGPATLINKAQNTFARSERTRVSAAKPTTPISINPAGRTRRRGRAGMR